jgi:hypothetical protein
MIYRRAEIPQSDAQLPALSTDLICRLRERMVPGPPKESC